MKMVTHHYAVSVLVPAVSGDGWNRYPDYSADETARALRRATQYAVENGLVTVEHVKTVNAPDEDKD